jgi:hypothetical protein
MKSFEDRPVTLFVDNVNFTPRLPEYGNRVTIIDIEITEEIAKKIIEELNQKIENHMIVGTVRIRLSGKMVLA